MSHQEVVSWNMLEKMKEGTALEADKKDFLAHAWTCELCIHELERLGVVQDRDALAFMP